MTRDSQRSVYGSHPLVWRRARLPTPIASPGSSSSAERYTEGHQRGSSAAFSRTSATSAAVPRTLQRETKRYSGAATGSRLPFRRLLRRGGAGRHGRAGARSASAAGILELLGEEPHANHVEGASAPIRLFPQETLAVESHALVGPHRVRIGRVDVETDFAEVHLL